MTEPEAPTLNELTEQAASVLKRVNPDVAAAHMTAALGKFRAQHSFEDTYVAPADAERRYEADVRAKYDRQLVLDVLLWAKGHEVAAAALQHELAASQQPPREANAQVDAMRELVALRRFENRTLADLAAAYEQTEDAQNPTFVALVERDVPAFRLTPDASTDGDARLRLNRLMAARREQRVPQALRDEHEKLKALRNASLSALVQYARDGVLKVAVKP